MITQNPVTYYNQGLKYHASNKNHINPSCPWLGIKDCAACNKVAMF